MVFFRSVSSEFGKVYSLDLTMVVGFRALKSLGFTRASGSGVLYSSSFRRTSFWKQGAVFQVPSFLNGALLRERGLR